jgi:thermitase
VVLGFFAAGSNGCVGDAGMLRRIASFLIAVAFLSAGASAVDVRLIGEKVSFTARDAPLQEVLRGFARAGVRVRADPGIQARVFGTPREEPVEDVLRKILEPFGYVLIWDVIEGPLGEYPKLAEIQVFPPGRPEKAALLRATPENFEVATGPDGRGPRFVPDEILIGFRAGTRRDEFERVVREIGGSVIECVKGVGVYRIRLPTGSNVPNLVEQLNRNPLVSRAEPNYVMEIIPPVCAGGAAAQDGEKREAASFARSAVAILDSGLLSLRELDGVVASAWDAIAPDRSPDDPVGHGTQMALIAGGSVAPLGGEESGQTAAGVPLIAVRAFDGNGRTSSFAMMRAIEYALEKGARVINMSWGSPTSSEFLETAIERAAGAGAIVVAAAGNEPTGLLMYPAAYPGVVAVSALGDDGALWPQSNTGAFVMFAAPGTARLPVGYKGPPGTYAGTSIASAYVSRALALYFDKHPKATAREAIAALKASARDAGSPGFDPKFGFGVVDGEAVMRLLQK